MSLDKCLCKTFIVKHILGEGMFAYIAKIKHDRNTVYKLIKTVVTKGDPLNCTQIGEESDLQLLLHNNLIADINRFKNEYPLFSYTYIPKPVCFSLDTFGFKYQNQLISCIFGMEEMKPINLGYNNGLPMHLAPIDSLEDAKEVTEADPYKGGINKERPTQGYFYGSLVQIDTLLSTYKSPIEDFFGIVKCLVYILASIIHTSKHIPIDMQFMLAKHNRTLKVICFDVGIYKQFEIMDDKVCIEIAESFYNRYLILGWEEIPILYETFRDTFIEISEKMGAEAGTNARRIMDIIDKEI